MEWLDKVNHYTWMTKVIREHRNGLLTLREAYERENMKQRANKNSISNKADA